MTPRDSPAQIPSVVDRSEQEHEARDKASETSVEDAEAEERATDEGMPEPPDAATSETAASTDVGPTPATEDDLEDDGGYDLGGEG